MMTSPNPVAAFEAEKRAMISSYADDRDFQNSSKSWLELAFRRRYMYNFRWFGRPIIQLPGDIMALQEAIADAKPDLIIETGIAHGGSLIFSASLLALLEMQKAVSEGTSFDPSNPRSRVLGIDIDIRSHNRTAIEAHPMSRWIEMFEGSSIAPSTVEQVRSFAARFERILVLLDSNHTHEHVLAELEAYAPLVSKGSYCLVFDTAIESLPEDLFADRPWGQGNNAATAAASYLEILRQEGRRSADGSSLELVLDDQLNDKLLLTAAPGGYLKRI